jgi:hypothetical protein
VKSLLFFDLQGVLKHHEELIQFVKERGVSVILLLRKNSLRRLVSLQANDYDRDIRLGKHKAHVHTQEEVRIYAASHDFMFKSERNRRRVGFEVGLLVRTDFQFEYIRLPYYRSLPYKNTY